MKKTCFNSRHGGNVYQFARNMGMNPEQILDFSANINPLGFSPRIKGVLPKAKLAILHYPDTDAHEFVSELSLYHNIPQENILAGNGSTEFIFLLPRFLHLRRALIVAPAFSEYASAVRLAGGRVCYFMTVESNNFSLNAARLIEELGSKRYDTVYICNPCNPTGVLTPREVMEQILYFAHKKGIKLIIDETFIDFCEHQSLKQEAKRFKNLFILRSMTKFFGIPGLRVGYLLSHCGNMERLKRIKEPWTMNAIGQLAGIESLRDKPYIEKTVSYITEARNMLFKELRKMPIFKVFDSAANFLLVRLTDNAPLSVDKLYEQLLQNGIIIRRCGNFQGLNECFFRVAVKKKSDNRRLINILKNIFVT